MISTNIRRESRRGFWLSGIADMHSPAEGAGNEDLRALAASGTEPEQVARTRAIWNQICDAQMREAHRC